MPRCIIEASSVHQLPPSPTRDFEISCRPLLILCYREYHLPSTKLTRKQARSPRAGYCHVVKRIDCSIFDTSGDLSHEASYEKTRPTTLLRSFPGPRDTTSRCGAREGSADCSSNSTWLTVSVPGKRHKEAWLVVL